MNIAQLWDQLVGAVCRPPRDTYDETDLVGGRRAAFMFGESRPTIKKYYRQDVELRNPRGQKLQCSHYRPCIVTSSDGRLPCCIYCHTNSGSRRDAEEILFHLLPHGITVFSLDFSGSGLSEGEWVTLGALEVEDLATAVAYLRDEGSTSTLAIWGRSMGAVTALLYSHRDPSIAGVVADSSFSRLTDLMLELATNENGASVATGGFSVPKPLVKVALTMIKRSVRRRAEFNIDHVAPLERVPETYVPTLFGHAKGDTFVAPHHSERLFVAHGADTKNFISFEGDHNDMRPEFWYDSALIFLLGVLRVEELVGPDLDLLGHDGDGGGGGGGIRFPHLSGRGIYVAGRSLHDDVDVDDHQDDRRRTIRGISAPWDISNTRIDGISSSLSMDEEGEDSKASSTSSSSFHRQASQVAALTRAPPPVGDDGSSIAIAGTLMQDEGEDEDDEMVLQRVIALSLKESASPNHVTTSGRREGEGEEIDEEEEAIAAAIAASLKEVEENGEGGGGGMVALDGDDDKVLIQNVSQEENEEEAEEQLEVMRQQAAKFTMTSLQ